MGIPLIPIPLQYADTLAQRLLAIGNTLKPIDEADSNYYFFEIVRELVDAALKNFNELRRSYTTGNRHLTAWASRNLLELLVFTKYVLKSGANAKRFGEDRLADGCELLIALRDLERHYDPTAPTPGLDDALTRMQDQMRIENVTARKHLEASALAREVGMEQEFRSMNRVTSKLVHPTAWSTLAENAGRNSYPETRELLFGTGIAQMSQILMHVRDYNNARGMTPLP